MKILFVFKSCFILCIFSHIVYKGIQKDFYRISCNKLISKLDCCDHNSFLDSNGIIPKKFDCQVLIVLKRFCGRIKRVRSEYKKVDSCSLLHDNVHKAIIR